MKKLIWSIGCVGLLCGCVSSRMDRDVDPQAGLSDYSHSPYYINYDIATNRVNGSGSATCWFWFFASDDGRYTPPAGVTFDACTRAAKGAATYDAIKKSGADALVGALYHYTTTDYFFYSETKCEAVGFPAYVKSVRQISKRPVVLEKDVQVIQLEPWEKLEDARAKTSVSFW
jgi:hypothetical protein